MQIPPNPAPMMATVELARPSWLSVIRALLVRVMWEISAAAGDLEDQVCDQLGVVEHRDVPEAGLVSTARESVQTKRWSE